MYMRMRRGILTSVMMKEPLATVPRWYRTNRSTDDRMGVSGSRFLSLDRKKMFYKKDTDYRVRV